MPGYIPLYLEGDTKNSTASAAVTGRQVLVVSGSGTVAPSSGASASVVGVAADDKPSGATVDYFSAGQQEVLASGAITAGTRVESAAGGKVASHTNGTNDYLACGTAVTTAADGAPVRVNFDH